MQLPICTGQASVQVCAAQEQNIWTESLPQPPVPHHAMESYRWRQTKTLRLYIEPPRVTAPLEQIFLLHICGSFKGSTHLPFPQSTLKVYLMASAGTLVIRLCDPPPSVLAPAVPASSFMDREYFSLGSFASTFTHSETLSLSPFWSLWLSGLSHS